MDERQLHSPPRQEKRLPHKVYQKGYGVNTLVEEDPHSWWGCTGLVTVTTQASHLTTKMGLVSPSEAGVPPECGEVLVLGGPVDMSSPSQRALCLTPDGMVAYLTQPATTEGFQLKPTTTKSWDPFTQALNGAPRIKAAKDVVPISPLSHLRQRTSTPTAESVPCVTLIYVALSFNKETKLRMAAGHVMTSSSDDHH